MIACHDERGEKEESGSVEVEIVVGREWVEGGRELGGEGSGK